MSITSRISNALGALVAAPAPAPAPSPVAVASGAISRMGRVPNTGARLTRMGGPSGFDIGKGGRRLAAVPSYTTSLNNLIQIYGTQAIARSRYLCLNNGYAKKARETWVAAVAGTGIKPSKLGAEPGAKEALQELWLDWCERADYDGLQDFYGLQSMAAGELFEAGEVFAVFEEQGDLDTDVLPLKIRLIQSEMCPFHANLAGVSPGNTVFMGIEFNAEGQRVAYHFLRRPPGEYSNMVRTYASETERIPAERVMHLFRPIRAGQVRGIPHTLAGMVTLAMVDLYDDAELERKRTAALFAAFVKKSSTVDAEDSVLGSMVSTTKTGPANSYPLEPGTVVGMEEGEDIVFSNPADVGANYASFEYQNLLRAAAGFAVPYAGITGDLRSVNYSSIRAGLVDFRRECESFQFHVMIFKFCVPVWRKFLDVATFWGLAPWRAADYADPVKRRALRRAKWLPPRWDWVDPLKDVQAEKLMVDEGFKSRADVVDSMGYDVEEVDARNAEDMKREEKLGLKYGTAKTDPPPVSATQEEDAAATAQNGGRNG